MTTPPVNAAGRVARAPAAGAPLGARVAWADIAKGASIVLVVLHHVLVKLWFPLDWGAGGEDGLWWRVESVFLPIRMPLFFAISGFFAAGAIRRPWRELWTRRTRRSAYLYALWVPLYFAGLLLLGPDLSVTRSELGVVEGVDDVLLALVVPTTTLWYVYALAAYVILAKTLARLPIAVWLPVAFALSIAVRAEWVPVDGVRASALANAVWFLAGAYLPGLLRAAASTATMVRVLALGAAFLTAVVAARHLPADVTPVAVVVLGVPGVWLGIALAVWASRLAVLRSSVAYIGRHTLPIFLLHVPLLAIVELLVPDGLPVGGASLVVPPVVAAATTGLALALHRFVLEPHAAWLLAPPPTRQTGRRWGRARSDATE